MNPEEIVQQFTPDDLAFIDSQGIAIANVRQQLKRFNDGFSPAKLVENVSQNHGVNVLSEAARKVFIGKYESLAREKQIFKFVPASGAASRMFRTLFSYLQDSENAMKKEGDALNRFFIELEKFAFYEDLKRKLKENGQSISNLLAQKDYRPILRALLTYKGLNYGQLPKVLLIFHRYEGGNRTALEEHLVEGANYCVGAGQHVYFHFTVSEQHIPLFQTLYEAVREKYEEKFGVTFHLSLSVQNPSTNTIAVDMDNRPFRNDDGTLLFRPGGHGALLENLNNLDTDLVFIKNVDNVTPDRLKGPTFEYKKVLGGVLLHYQGKIFTFLRQLTALSKDQELSNELEETLLRFIKNELCIIPPDDFGNWSNQTKKTYIISKLNRPIRACGIVRSTGKTGGGPFWVQDHDGGISLQIVETPQINLEDVSQKHIFETSTYFNVTDLACGLKDFEGKKFDLMPYRDDEAGFITQKSKNGLDLKAQELPGLWNGSMADWNTIFVEVPAATFTPVKTVMNLLDEEHQN